MNLLLEGRPRGWDSLVQDFERQEIPARIWTHDVSVWGSAPDEIANRLAWLDLPSSMLPKIEPIERAARQVVEDGVRYVVLLGMGGSSLAARTFAATLPRAAGYPEFAALDSTHPHAIREVEAKLDLPRTLFLVASKSGTTMETLAFFRYFHEKVREYADDETAGRQFVAVTDPGTRLEALARTERFRAVFHADPNVGGRYSAFSHFGLVPAGLCGIDIRTLLSQAHTFATHLADEPRVARNPALALGLAFAEHALLGRNKLTFVLSRDIAAFGDWVEQLIAESTGKDGRGVVPVVGERLTVPEAYAADRVFVHVTTAHAEPNAANRLAALAASGHPVLSVELDGISELAALLYAWEWATAVAGHVLGVNPFDQPNVESAKSETRRFVHAYRGDERSRAAHAEPLTAQRTADFLAAQRRGYAAIQAYLPPSEPTSAALRQLQAAIRDRFRLATTAGYGPRFLHSTGQLHKGDSGEGVFIQLVSHDLETVRIPADREDPEGAGAMTFGALIRAQAAGDRAALERAGRRVITLATSTNETILEAAAGL